MGGRGGGGGRGKVTKRDASYFNVSLIVEVGEGGVKSQRQIRAILMFH